MAPCSQRGFFRCFRGPWSIDSLDFSEVKGVKSMPCSITPICKPQGKHRSLRISWTGSDATGRCGPLYTVSLPKLSP